MWKAVGYLKKHLVWSLPVAMLIGLVLGNVIDPRPLKMLVLPLTVLMVYPMMVNLEIRKLLTCFNWRLQLAAQAVNFLLIPAIGFGLARWFFPEQPLMALGLLFIAVLPTSGMTISWTGFGKGNVQASVQMTVLGLLVGAVLAPIYVGGLMGQQVDIPMMKIATSILLLVLIPMVLGNVTRRLLVRRYGLQHFNESIKQKFPALSTLGVLGIVLVAMALKAKMLVADPMAIPQILIPLLLFYAVNYTLITLLGRYAFPREDAVALVFGTVMRNLSVALAIAMTAFGQAGTDIALVIALAYMIQVKSAAWYVRVLERLDDKASQLVRQCDANEIGTVNEMTNRFAELATEPVKEFTRE